MCLTVTNSSGKMTNTLAYRDTECITVEKSFIESAFAGRFNWVSFGSLPESGHFVFHSRTIIKPAGVQITSIYSYVPTWIVCLSVHKSVCLSVFLSFNQSIYHFVHLSFSPSLSIYHFYLSVCPSRYLSICLSICLSVHISNCLYILFCHVVCLPFSPFPSIYLSIWPSRHLSVYVPVYLSVCSYIMLLVYLFFYLAINLSCSPFVLQTLNSSFCLFVSLTTCLFDFLSAHQLVTLSVCPFVF